ncbi:MAG: signal peptidase I [Holosporales bacterium]|jgi:signal peptidase I|nr:signal peptidase I [Holosporales bacterium]
MSEKKEKKGEGLLGWVLVILAVLSIHIFLYQPYKIPSGSMMPTLLVGDFVFANKFLYGYSRYSIFFQPKFIKKRISFAKPKCGDVAVFFHKFYEGEDANFYNHGMFNGFFQKSWRKIRQSLSIPLEGVNYVKRVIGVPGDKIQMKQGKLYINGQETKLDYVGEYPIEEEKNIIITKLYTETLPNGKQHPILKIFEFGKAHLDNTEEFTVPEGHYFMMGDNRDNSSDSREIKKVGFISEDLFIGKPQMIFFSTKAQWYEIHKWLFDLRYSRLLNIVR